MEERKENNGKTSPNGDQLPLSAISVLPVGSWGIAGLLAVLPAIGFYLLLRSLTTEARPSFIFFYWMAAIYVLMRKATLMSQLFKRAAVLLGLEAAAYLVLGIWL